MEKKKLEKALELMEKDEYKKALTELGKILKKTNDIYTKNKISTFVNICKLKTDKCVEKEDTYTKAVYLLNNNSLDEAIELLNSMLKKDKQNDSLFYTLSLAYIKKGDEENALLHLTKSIEMNYKNKFHAFNEELLRPLTENLEDI